MARSIERAQSSMFRDQGRSLGRVRDPNADDHWERIAGCGSPPVGFLGRCGRCANSWTVATCRFGCHALPKGFLRASHIRRTARPADQARIDPIAPPLANQAVNRQPVVHAVPTHSRWRRHLPCCRTHTTLPQRSRHGARSPQASRYRPRHIVTSTFAVIRAGENMRGAANPRERSLPAPVGDRPRLSRFRNDPAARPLPTKTRSRASARRPSGRCIPFAPRPEIASPRRHRTTATAAIARVSARVSPPSRRSDR